MSPQSKKLRATFANGYVVERNSTRDYNAAWAVVNGLMHCERGFARDRAAAEKAANAAMQSWQREHRRHSNVDRPLAVEIVDIVPVAA